MYSLSNPCRLYTSASGAAPSDCCFMAVRSMGIDVIGPISPSSTKGHRFLLAITDYFSKWAEAIPLIEVKISNVVNFIKLHVIHWIGVPRQIIHDNGPQFISQIFYQFCDKYRVQNVVSTAYNSAANGLAKAFNKTIIKLSFHQISETRMRSSVNVFRPTEPQFRPRQAIRLFLWYTNVKQSYH